MVYTQLDPQIQNEKIKKNKTKTTLEEKNSMEVKGLKAIRGQRGTTHEFLLWI